MQRAKQVGYLLEEYYYITTDISEIPWMGALIDKFREEARHTAQPPWYVKFASIYFTYQDRFYEIHYGHLNTSQEIFEVLANDIIDCLYEHGAYNMFYGGMLD